MAFFKSTWNKLSVGYFANVIQMYISVTTWALAWIQVCVSVCLSVFVCVCVCVCLSVFVCVCLFVWTNPELSVKYIRRPLSSLPDIVITIQTSKANYLPV